MEKIKDLLKEDKEERILWSGSPDKFALKENYAYFRIYALLFISFIIILIIVGIINGPVFMIMIIPASLIVIIALSLYFHNLYKKRHHENVFYAITTHRAFIHCPIIHEGKKKIGDSIEEILTIDDGDYRNDLFFFKSAIARNESAVYVDLSNIKEIQVRPGQRGYDFFFTYGGNKKIMKFKFAALVLGYGKLLETLSKMKYNFQIVES